MKDVLMMPKILLKKQKIWHLSRARNILTKQPLILRMIIMTTPMTTMMTTMMMMTTTMTIN
jgi:hypothetical protein